MTVAPSIAVATSSPKESCESFRISVLGSSGYQCVQMILHETVRNYFNVELPCGEQQLHADEIDGLRICEVMAALKGAHREENPGSTKVDVMRESRRSAMRHAGACANVVPLG